MYAADASALLVSRRGSHLVESRRQLCRVVEDNVVAVSLCRLKRRSGGDDALHETCFYVPFLIVIDAGEIDYGLDFSVRLFAKREKLAGKLNCGGERWSFFGHIVVINTHENG